MKRATRKLPVPIALPSGRVRPGHLLPDLRRLERHGRQPTGFVCLPGGTAARYGMLAHVGVEVTPEEMLARWERDVGAVKDREGSLSWLREFVAALGGLKLGNVVEIRYPRGGVPRLEKLREAPPAQHIAPLPE